MPNIATNQLYTPGSKHSLAFGMEAQFTYNGLTINDLRSSIEQYRLTQMPQGFDDADVIDSRDQKPTRWGELPHAPQHAGRTMVLSGEIRAGNTFKLRDMETALKTAFMLPVDNSELPLLITQPNLSTITNPVTNPSFEYDLVNNSPIAWSNNIGGHLAGTATLTVVNTTAAIGSQSCKVVTTGTVDAGAANALEETFVAGTTYKLQIWMRGNTGGERCGVVFGVAGGDNGHISKTLTTGWQQVTVSWTPASTTSAAFLSAREESGVASTFFIDEAGPVPYFDGDTYFYHWEATPGSSISSSNVPPPVQIYCRKNDKIQVQQLIDRVSEYRSAFQITLRASDPRFYAVTPRTATLVPSVISRTGRSYSRVYDMKYSSFLNPSGYPISSSGDSIVLTNRGNIDMYPIINLYGMMSNIVISNNTTGQNINIPVTIPAGEYLHINIMTGEITDSAGNNRSSWVSADSDDLVLSPGDNIFGLSVDGFDANAKLDFTGIDTYF